MAEHRQGTQEAEPQEQQEQAQTGSRTRTDRMEKGGPLLVHTGQSFYHMMMFVMLIGIVLISTLINLLAI